MCAPYHSLLAHTQGLAMVKPPLENAHLGLLQTESLLNQLHPGSVSIKLFGALKHHEVFLATHKLLNLVRVKLGLRQPSFLQDTSTIGRIASAHRFRTDAITGTRSSSPKNHHTWSLLRFPDLLMPRE